MRFFLRWTWVGFLMGCGVWLGWYFGQGCYWFGQQLRAWGWL